MVSLANTYYKKGQLPRAQRLLVQAEEMLGKILPSIGPSGFKAFAREGAKLWARFGYTTAQEGRSEPGTVAIMQQVAAEGGFPIDVVTYADVLVDRDFIRNGFSKDYANRFRIAGEIAEIGAARRASPPGATSPITSRSATILPAIPAMLLPPPNRCSMPCNGQPGTRSSC